MKYDVIIIGSGIAGLTTGIYLTLKGKKTIIISKGMGGLHFAFGGIGVISKDPLTNKIINNPLEYLPSFIKEQKEHPYSIVGIDDIIDSLKFFRDICKREGHILFSSKEGNNIPTPSPIGAIHLLYLLPESLYNGQLFPNMRILVVDICGFRDFDASILAENLQNSSFNNLKGIKTKYISIELLPAKRVQDLRSSDFERIFLERNYLENFISFLKKEEKEFDKIAIPALLGIEHHTEIFEILKKELNNKVFEVPTFPPSLLGIRLNKVLEEIFLKNGGTLRIGRKVDKVTIKDNKCIEIYIDAPHNASYNAKYIVLATGSFFGGGLSSDFEKISETIFNLPVIGAYSRNKSYFDKFLDSKGHPFFQFGIKVNSNFQPIDSDGKIVVENLFAVGSILQGYNPVIEGSGGGVAIATGYKVGKIIERLLNL